MRSFTTFILSMSFFGLSFGQIKIDNSKTAEYYVKNVLLGPGIEVGQIKHIGMIGGLGQFEAPPEIIGLSSGLILSTGNVDSINVPNNTSDYTSWGQWPKSKQLMREITKGDKDLNNLCKGRTTDITVIEFDFVPVKNVLEFNYVFASEEYPEYVGSKFNDVFGFFLSGPGIKKKINLAVLPDGKTPISINNVNQKKNSEYFRKNNSRIKLPAKIFSKKIKLIEMRELKKQLQFDGLTTVLTAHYDVIPYQKYHIKIAIGDVTDRIFDSGVFLESGSFVSVKDTSGKYFAKLEALNDRVPDIDSILGMKTAIDSVIPAQINENFEITDIDFDPDSYSLIDSSRTQLDKLADYLQSKKTFKCTLFGYTDNVGSKKYNQSLSEKRAIAVIDYLTMKGIERKRLSYTGHSFENPKSDNSTEEGRAKNRRVEIIIEE